LARRNGGGDPEGDEDLSEGAVVLRPACPLRAGVTLPGGTTSPAADQTSTYSYFIIARAMSDPDVKKVGVDLAGSAIFYSHSRVLADFLIERSEDPLIHPRIARACLSVSSWRSAS